MKEEEFHQLLRKIRENIKLKIVMQWENKTSKPIKEAVGTVHI